MTYFTGIKERDMTPRPDHPLATLLIECLALYAQAH